MYGVTPLFEWDLGLVLYAGFAYVNMDLSICILQFAPTVQAQTG